MAKEDDKKDMKDKLKEKTNPSENVYNGDRLEALIEMLVDMDIIKPTDIAKLP